LRNYNLNFISNKDLYNHTKATVEQYRFQIDLAKFNKNLIDPIKLTFDAKVYHKDIRDVIDNEIVRQMDKSNTNHIGYFHQNIFKFIGDGWMVAKSGYDVVNPKMRHYVEIKNKHNTMNSSSSQKTYMRMQNTILTIPDATCMLVEVIAKKSQNSVWNMSLDGIPVAHEQIRRVSIDKFYELVTGNTTAFKQLCETLPVVIDDIVQEEKSPDAVNTVFAELQQISPNLLKSLYLLSFSQYEGFGDFDVA
jgi:hypothetical protein